MGMRRHQAYALLPQDCQRLGQMLDLDDWQSVLDINLSTRFEHWVNRPLFFPDTSSANCVWTTRLAGECFTLPVAHGEGRLVPEGSPAYLITAVYGRKSDGELFNSPNGSVIAAICSPDGLVMGMMPHPERRIDALRGGTQGLAIFQAGVTAVC